MFTRNTATFVVLAAAVLAAPGLPAEDVVLATNPNHGSATALDPKTVAWSRATVAGLLTQHGLSSEQGVSR